MERHKAMIHQQRVSNQMLNTIVVTDTPFACNRCGFQANGEDLLKFHMKDWTEIHKDLNKKGSFQH